MTAARPTSHDDRAERLELAIELMERFAERTGVGDHVPPRRYLWTDAFAVCTSLGLDRATGQAQFTELALRLVDQVHHTLGRHRGDDERAGWLSGLPDEQARLHPTAGGLRIGKPLPERRPHEPPDDDLEWSRDGQYFHYLTKWMVALDHVSRATGQPLFNVWARELAEAAHRAFASGPPGARRLVWKASIDLSRPIVTSMGQHDPLDGMTTCAELDLTAREVGASSGPDLSPVIQDLASMVDRRRLATDDPLGLGGLLVDAVRVERLVRRGARSVDDSLVEALVGAAIDGLIRYLARSDLRLAAHRRLAFRELGLSIGLAAIERMAADVQARLSRFAGARGEIETFWMRAENRLGAWLDHEDINDVMLATSLAPDGFVAAP